MKKLSMKLFLLSLVSIVSVQAMGDIKEKCKTAARYAITNASYLATYVPQAYDYTYAGIPVGAIAMNTVNVASAGYQTYMGYKIAKSYAHDSVTADVDAYYHAVVQKLHSFDKENDDSAQEINEAIEKLTEIFMTQISSKITNVDDVRTHVMTLKAIIASAFDQKIRRGLHDKELINATSMDMALFHASKECKSITDTIKKLAQESIVGVAKSAVIDAKNKVLKHPYATAATIVTGLNIVFAASYAALS